MGEKGNVAAAGQSIVERAGDAAGGLTGVAVTKSVEVVVEGAIKGATAPDGETEETEGGDAPTDA